jgi:transposase
VLGNYIDSNGFDLKTVKSTCTLRYNKVSDIFTLFIPETCNVENNNNNHIISIDPGIRVFLTGLSNNHVTEIGTNISPTIEKYLKKIDKINRTNKINKHVVPKKIRDRYNNVYSKKLQDKITDLHWKAINFLTNKNY